MKCGGYSNRNCELARVDPVTDEAPVSIPDAAEVAPTRTPEDATSKKKGVAATGVSTAAKLAILIPFLAVASTTILLLARITTAKAAVAKAKAAKQTSVKLDIHQVLFTQATIADSFRDGRPVSAMVEALHDGSLRPADVPKIRVVRKHGQYFTLDHRRLYALRKGLRDHSSAHHLIPVTLESFKNLEIVDEFKRKCSTKNPHDITIERGWMATWKPFVQAAVPPKRVDESLDADADVDDEMLAKSWGIDKPQIYAKQRHTAVKRKSKTQQDEEAAKRFLDDDEDEDSSNSEESEDEDEE